MLGPTRDNMMHGVRVPIYNVSRWTYHDIPLFLLIKEILVTC